MPNLRYADRPRRADPRGAQRSRAGPALGDRGMQPPGGCAQHRPRRVAGYLDRARPAAVARDVGLIRAIRAVKPRYRPRHERSPGARMKLTEPVLRNALGGRRVFGLALLLAAVAAVAYLERSVAGDFDLRLVYFLIVLVGAMLLPRVLALAIAVGVAIVSVGIIGSTGT